jgi:hypothetical protein
MRLLETRQPSALIDAKQERNKTRNSPRGSKGKHSTSHPKESPRIWRFHEPLIGRRVKTSSLLWALHGAKGFPRDSRRVLTRTSKEHTYRTSCSLRRLSPLIRNHRDSSPGPDYSWEPLFHRCSEPSMQVRRGARELHVCAVILFKKMLFIG